VRRLQLQLLRRLLLLLLHLEEVTMSAAERLALDLEGLGVEPLEMAGGFGPSSLDSLDIGHGVTETGASVGLPCSCCSCCIACCCCCCPG
jgi:hypothetical protein